MLSGYVKLKDSLDVLLDHQVLRILDQLGHSDGQGM